MGGWGCSDRTQILESQGAAAHVLWDRPTPDRLEEECGSVQRQGWGGLLLWLVLDVFMCKNKKNTYVHTLRLAEELSHEQESGM